MIEHEVDGDDPYSIVKPDQIATLFSSICRSCGIGYHDVMGDCDRDSRPTSHLQLHQVVSRPARVCEKRGKMAEQQLGCCTTWVRMVLTRYEHASSLYYIA